MPFTYHYPLSDFDHESFNDDSIVLSDLIRTGETSRLRRRGAMRIEHTGSSTASRQRYWRSNHQPLAEDIATQPYGDDSSPGYSWTVVDNDDNNINANRSSSRRVLGHLPMLEVSDDDEDFEFEGAASDSDSGDEMVFSASFNSAISEQTGYPVYPNGSGLSYSSSRTRRRRSRSSLESEGGEKASSEQFTFYSLVCGGPIDDIAICTRSAPEPVYSTLASFILPQPLSPHYSSSSSSSSSSSGFNDHNTNGCGAVIHTRAVPRYRHHQPIWTATTPATNDVVPLDRMYFSEICVKEKLSPRMMRQEACGCLRIGIGCANCGNPLGFRLTPCKTLRDHLASRRSLSRSPRHSSSSTTKSNTEEDQNIYLYTFFCNSTTSPQTSIFPVTEPPTPTSNTFHRRRWDWSSRPRTATSAAGTGVVTYTDTPLLPPPPPLIRLEVSDSDEDDEEDEEIVIDFRTPPPPAPSSSRGVVLGGDLTASPEPSVVRLVEPSRHSVSPDHHPHHHHYHYHHQQQQRTVSPAPRRQRWQSPTTTTTSVVHPAVGIENGEDEDDTELGQVRASWANVVRGVEAAASSLGEDMVEDNAQQQQQVTATTEAVARPRRPRRGALGFDAENELGITPSSAVVTTSSSTPSGDDHNTPTTPTAETTSQSEMDLPNTVPSILLDAARAVTPPPPIPRQFLFSHDEGDGDVDDGDGMGDAQGANTPRATTAAGWGSMSSFADEGGSDESPPPSSFWGRPAPGSGNAWTWSNELAELEASQEQQQQQQRGTDRLSELEEPRDRHEGEVVEDNRPMRRVFDPDGEFLEGLEGEWGEDMARQLGFSVEEKSEGGENTPTTTTAGFGGFWWL